MAQTTHADDRDFELMLHEALSSGAAALHAPAPSHAEHVRERLLARCGPATAPPRKPWRWARRLAGIAAAAALLVAVLAGRRHSAAAVEELRSALRGLPWVHTEMLGPDGLRMETWMSAKRGVAAARAGEWVVYDDLRSGIRHEYRPTENALFRTALSDPLAGSFRDALEVFGQMVRGDESLSPGGRTAEIVEQSKRAVPAGTEYTMTYRLAGNRQVTTVVRVSGDTRRPDTATIQAEDGLRLVCRFDYPEFGPRDAYELGVPREVPVIDRVPAPDLQRIIAGVTDGRRRFDAYYCVLVHSNAAHHWSRTNRLYRTWRKGDCWRIEQSFSDPQDDEELWGSPLPAENVDRAQYWFERARRTRFYPVIVCDGRHVFRFKHEFSDPAQKRITFQTARAERDYMDYDPSFAMLPLYTPAPELEGHCATLGGAGPRVVERLIADPVDGPPGTVLVEREYSGRRGQADKQDLDRFWIDPVNGFLVMRYEMVDLDRDVPEVMQSRQVLSFNRSPSGYFYPTLLRWDQSGLAHYYVDFEAKFDDVIFQPDATAAVRQD